MDAQVDSGLLFHWVLCTSACSHRDPYDGMPVFVMLGSSGLWGLQCYRGAAWTQLIAEVCFIPISSARHHSLPAVPLGPSGFSGGGGAGKVRCHPDKEGTRPQQQLLTFQLGMSCR